MKKLFFSFWYKVFGWKIVGTKPDLKKYVIIVAPHTSNLDFFVGLAARSIIGLQSNFLAKKSLFNIPFVGWLMKSLGGHAVDRTKKMNMVDQVVELFETHEEFVMTVTPEGTRSYNPDWKTGFYRIAVKANVPIVMVSFDFENKVVTFKDPFYPSGDIEGDFEMIKSYYRTIKGRHPEKGIK